LRPVDLHHPALGQTADPQRQVELQGTGGDGLHGQGGTVAHAHDRALAELLLDLAQGGGQRTLLVLIHLGVPLQLSGPGWWAFWRGWIAKPATTPLGSFRAPAAASREPRRTG